MTTLSNSEILNFLHHIKNEDIPAVQGICEDLDQGKPLDEIFKETWCIFHGKKKKMRGYYIEAVKLEKLRYKIEFGGVFDPLAGSGGTWIVEFDDKDQLKLCKKTDDWVA